MLFFELIDDLVVGCTPSKDGFQAGRMFMPRNAPNAVLIACGAVALIGSPVVPALAAIQLGQAELADLTPGLQTQAQARAVNDN
jgi:hypothetical protein